MKRLLDTNAYAALKRDHEGVTRLVRETAMSTRRPAFTC